MRKLHTLLLAILLMQGCKKSSNQAATASYSSITNTGTDSLSQPRAELGAAAAGNKIVFAGGGTLIPPNTYSTETATVDIYDTATHTWSAAQLSEARGYLAAAAAGTKILFAGGENASGYSKAVDIYDAGTGIWSTDQLSIARRDLAAAAVGTKVLFAGGFNDTSLLNTVDIYDISSGKWATAQLSHARAELAGAAAGGKAVFAGGADTTDVSGVVDIYNLNNGAWTTAQLSVPRVYLTAAAAGSKILFAGGVEYDPSTKVFTHSAAVDIYDVNTGIWTTSQLSEGRSQLTAAASGNLIVFAGGVDNNNTISRTVDIYNVTTNAWTTAQLGGPRFNLAAAALGDILLVGGGGGAGTGTGYSSMVDVFTLDK